MGRWDFSGLNPPPRTFDANHFWWYVALRLGFTYDLDGSLGGTARDVADLSGRDIEGVTNGDFDDAASHMNSLVRQLDAGRAYDFAGTAGDLGGELDGQAGQPLPDGSTLPPDAGDTLSRGESVRRTVQGLGDGIDRVRRVFGR